jgi:hypothetical protein
MKCIVTLALLSFCAFAGLSQTPGPEFSIEEEGKLHYKSEKTSWLGTDLFVEKFKDRLDMTGGYLSYSEGKSTKCIFFTTSDSAKVIATMSFDSTINFRTAFADGTRREFTPAEHHLFTIRRLALKEIQSDTLFKRYANTDLNLIPLITAKGKQVFVLTGPKKNGEMIFGNDYLLTFDKNNVLKTKRCLHKNILISDFGSTNDGSKTVTGGIHSHLPSTGEFITPKDICTMMLCEKLAKLEN